MEISGEVDLNTEALLPSMDHFPDLLATAPQMLDFYNGSELHTDPSLPLLMEASKLLLPPSG